MRKACLAGAVILAVTVLSGCGSDDDKPDKPSGTRAGSQRGETAPADDKRTVIERASGSWRTIQSKTDIETLAIKDGHVSAKGRSLECVGTLKPGTYEGEESPSLAFSSCKGSTDGGRGLGHLTLKDSKNDALAINWEGTESWGGPVDSFRRAG